MNWVKDLLQKLIIFIGHPARLMVLLMVNLCIIKLLIIHQVVINRFTDCTVIGALGKVQSITHKKFDSCFEQGSITRGFGFCSVIAAMAVGSS